MTILLVKPPSVAWSCDGLYICANVHSLRHREVSACRGSVRRPRSGRPRADRPRRPRGVRREGLPRRHDRRRRPAVRPVGRRDLHLLPGQGGALPPELRPDLRAAASRSSATASRRPTRPRTGCATRSAYYVESIDAVRWRARAGRPWSAPGPRRTSSPASATCSSGAASGSSGPASCCSAEGVARGELPAWLDVDGVRARVPGPARRAAPATDRGRREPTARRTRCGAPVPCSTRSSRARSPPRQLRGSGPGARRDARSIAGDGPRPDGPRPDRPRPTSG